MINRNDLRDPRSRVTDQVIEAVGAEAKFAVASVRMLARNPSALTMDILTRQSGYYDQAHFNADFKEFSGINPTTYRLKIGDEPNYLPVGVRSDGADSRILVLTGT